nr:DUF4175 family protein [Luteolibacter luteus]
MKTSEARQDIERRLAAVRSGIRRAQWMRGGFLVATVALGGLLAIMAADHLLAPLPVAARWVMFGAWVAAILVAGCAGLRPLIRKIGLVQVARWIEGRHPEIEERMSTVMELSGGDAGASADLLAELARAANEDVGRVDAKAEMKAAGAGKRWAKPAAALAVLTLLLFAVWPKEVSRLAVRAVAPFSKVGNAAAVKFELKPGNVELLEGDAIEIVANYEGHADKLEVVMEMGATGIEVTQPMYPEGDAWRYRMDPVREGFSYRARAGRGESDRFTVTVWPLPTVVQPRVRLRFPEYTGVIPQEEPLGRGIEAIRGTMVEISGALNTAVEEGWLEIDGKRVADAKIERAADGGRMSVSWNLEENGAGDAVLWLKHRLGREVDALRFPVRVLEDAAPVVRWLSPIAKEIRVRPDEVLGLRYEITEDFGVAAVQIEAKTEGKEPVRLAQDLPERFGAATKPARFRGGNEVAVGELLERWQGAGEIRMRVRAEDGRTKELKGPGVGHSEWILLRIDRGAESLARQEMRAEHDGAHETIEQAMRATREARERMDWHRGEMQREELSKDAVKHFEEARERLAEAQQKLSELSDRMQESVHATKADEVRQAAEQVAQARQELESAPLQDGKEQREEKLDIAREKAEDAVRKLEEVRNRMERDRQKIEELARLQELAQQQRELARQAERQVAENREEKALPEDWQNRQRQMEEQLRQQLREQPQARAEVLEDQAKEAREMADQARALSEAQKELEEQAKQIPANASVPEQAERSVRESLQKEQAKIAEQAAQQLAEAQKERSEAADVLPEVVAETKQASESLAKGEDKAAAESAKEAAQALREAAKSEQGQPEQGQPEQGQPEQGQPEQGQPEQGQPEQGQPEQGQPEQGQSEQGQSEQGQSEQGQSEQGQSEQGQSEQGQSTQAAQMEALAERQEKVAEALNSLAEGKTAEAVQSLQQMQAEQAGEFSEAIARMPQAEGSGNMNEAKDASHQGGEQAKAAAQSGQEGKLQEAAGQHNQSSNSLQRSADALGRAAEEFARNAEQAKGQQPEQHRVPIPPTDLADAFQSAAKAAGEKQEGSEAANQASQAADALSRAAQAARQSMQGQNQGQPGQPGMPQPGNQPGEKPEEGDRSPEADPGVPPELAKLGISAADWEKIQATLKSDVGGGAGTGVPEEYRGLVKKYFEAMADE